MNSGKSETISSDSPIIIYQMGKVGSTALFESLNSLNKSVYQIHALSATHLDSIKNRLQASGLGLPQHIKDSFKIRSQYCDTKKPVHILTPIRSSLDRNISAFFQQLSTSILTNSEIRRILGINSRILLVKKLPIRNEWKNEIVVRLTAQKWLSNVNMLKEYFVLNFRHDYATEWFNTEFKEALNIDVFELPFDLERGFQEFESEYGKAIVFKSELEREEKRLIIENFLGYKINKITQSHISKNKKYGRAMYAFKEIIERDSKIKEIYGSQRFQNHFYPLSK